MLHELGPAPAQLTPLACSMWLAQQLSVLLTYLSSLSLLQSRYLLSWEKVRGAACIPVDSASQALPLLDLHMRSSAVSELAACQALLGGCWSAGTGRRTTAWPSR